MKLFFQRCVFGDSESMRDLLFGDWNGSRSCAFSSAVTAYPLPEQDCGDGKECDGKGAPEVKKKLSRRDGGIARVSRVAQLIQDRETLGLASRVKAGRFEIRAIGRVWETVGKNTAARRA